MTDSPNPVRAWRRRQKPKVTLEELAKRLDTTDATVSRLETGKVEMTVQWARRISAATGIPMRELLPDLAAEFVEDQPEPAGATP